MKFINSDLPLADAVALFCYQVKKWIGSFAASPGGLDTLVFAGGIGENAPLVRTHLRWAIFLGIELHKERNAKSARVISTNASRASVRVIRTDEELMVCRALGLATTSEKGIPTDDEIHLSAGPVFGGRGPPAKDTGSMNRLPRSIPNDMATPPKVWIDRWWADRNATKGAI